MRIDPKWLHQTEVQKIQQKVSRIVADYPKDAREDKSLIEAFRKGNQDAGKALIENYLDIISIIYNKPSNPPKMRKPDGQRFITRPPAPSQSDREDVIQEILYQFFTLVYEYDESFMLPFHALIKGKLFLRFHNQYYREFFEIRSKETEFDEEFVGSYGYTYEMDLTEEEQKKVPAQYLELYEALDKLSKQQREVIELSVVKGWDSTVVAQEIGSTSGAVRKAKERGLDKLKNLMGAVESDKAS